MCGARILVVEDEKDWRKKLRRNLERAGYLVDVAGGYGEALGKLRQGAFDLVVTDLRLGPEQSPGDFEGMALLADAREKGVPTLVVTGYADVAIARRAYSEYDIAHFMEKRSFTARRFVQIVGQILPPLRRMEYHHFDLWIEAPTAKDYPVRANAQTMGQANGLLRFDPASPTVQNYLARLAARDTDADFLTKFGTFLHNSLFSDDIGSLFQRSLGEVDRQEERGLRIRLRIGPPELTVIPWEYLYCPSRECFLGASKKTPLIRYLEGPPPIRELNTGLPLQVLVVIPASSGLDTEKEKEILTQALGKLGTAVRPRFVGGLATRSAVADALLEEQYHVFHFIGHGEFRDGRGYLLLDDEDAEPDPIDDQVFARLFLNELSMKLVVLNACEGATVSASKAMVGLAPGLVQRGIPAVIAHQYPVQDKAALCFAREFYRSLCGGTQAGYVDVAMAHARNQLSIRLPDDRYLGSPVLFMRAPDGLIFTLHP